jgi:hypothetical protein
VISLSDLQRDPETRKYLDRADEVLGAIGYTEHGRCHAGVVVQARLFPARGPRAAQARHVSWPRRYTCTTSGNVVNRDHHAQSGAVLAHEILRNLGCRSTRIGDRDGDRPPPRRMGHRSATSRPP